MGLTGRVVEMHLSTYMHEHINVHTFTYIYLHIYPTRQEKARKKINAPGRGLTYTHTYIHISNLLKKAPGRPQSSYLPRSPGSHTSTYIHTST